MDRNNFCLLYFTGKTIQFQDCLIIRYYFNTEEAQSFVISTEISLWPWVLFWANNLIILTISLTQNSKEERLSQVSKFILSGTVLFLDVWVHCLLKKLLNRFAFPISLTSLLSTSIGGINGILQPFIHSNCFQNCPIFFESCLSSLRYQRVLLNYQTSKWSQIKAGVPKGSVLRPLLFLCLYTWFSRWINFKCQTFCCYFHLLEDS